MDEEEEGEEQEEEEQEQEQEEEERIIRRRRRTKRGRRRRTRRRMYRAALPPTVVVTADDAVARRVPSGFHSHDVTLAVCPCSATCSKGTVPPVRATTSNHVPTPRRRTEKERETLPLVPV